MKLSEDQIKDLESRGIKPGVKLRSAYGSDERIEFTLKSWDDFENDEEGSISSVTCKYGKNGNRDVWIFDVANNEYATPIQ